MACYWVCHCRCLSRSNVLHNLIFGHEHQIPLDLSWRTIGICQWQQTSPRNESRTDPGPWNPGCHWVPDLYQLRRHERVPSQILWTSQTNSKVVSGLKGVNGDCHDDCWTAPDPDRIWFLNGSRQSIWISSQHLDTTQDLSKTRWGAAKRGEGIALQYEHHSSSPGIYQSWSSFCSSTKITEEPHQPSGTFWSLSLWLLMSFPWFLSFDMTPWEC